MCNTGGVTLQLQGHTLQGCAKITYEAACEGSTTLTALPVVQAPAWLVHMCRSSDWLFVV